MRTLLYTVEKLEVIVRLHRTAHMIVEYMCHVCKFWMDDGPGPKAVQLHAGTPHQCAMRGVRTSNECVLIILM